MNRTKKILSSFLLLGSCFFNTATAGLIDLQTWSEVDPSNEGQWNVSGDGTSVLQTENGNPTFFVSDQSFINSEFTGSFSVETTQDDDFIGFVFGYNGLDDFYLFDWKQTTQNHIGTAQEGFTLSKISAGVDWNGLATWSHSTAGLTVLDTDYGSGKGWLDNVEYSFTLGYTDTEINIGINGGQFVNEQIFSLTGLTNQAGKFGFYNSSQAGVRYTGFEEDVCTQNCGNVEVPEPSSVALFSLLALGLGARRFKK